MDRLKSFSENLTVDKVKGELQPSSLKNRAKALNERYSSPSTQSTSYGRLVPPARPKPATLASDGGRSTSESGRMLPPRPAAPVRPSSGGQRERIVPEEEPPASAKGEERIDWPNLTHDDKLSLFAVLDQFFAADLTPATALEIDQNADVVQLPQAPATKQTIAKHSGRQPLLPSKHDHQHQNQSYTSYPSRPSSSSHAHDIANYFLPSTPWSSGWFTGKAQVPPPLEGRKDATYTSSWQSLGNQKTLVGAALFCDLSVAWWQVEWDMSNEKRSGFLDTIHRRAKYLDAPAPFQAQQLWQACSTFGEQVALFAEEAERRGRPVGRGECWDIASEALASIKSISRPVPSLARTHGHLIFSGSAHGKNYRTDQHGKWRGGDSSVRRGDIVEWRTARVASKTGNSWSDLGNPDHTAVIVQSYLSSEPGANTEPKNGEDIPPWAIGVLEVIEQSQGKVPSRAVYNLSGFQKGEIWIYRPVSLQEYVGIDAIKPDWNQASSRGSIYQIS